MDARECRTESVVSIAFLLCRLNFILSLKLARFSLEIKIIIHETKINSSI